MGTKPTVEPMMLAAPMDHRTGTLQTDPGFYDPYQVRTRDCGRGKFSPVTMPFRNGLENVHYTEIPFQ